MVSNSFYHNYQKLKDLTWFKLTSFDYKINKVYTKKHYLTYGSGIQTI